MSSTHGTRGSPGTEGDEGREFVTPAQYGIPGPSASQRLSPLDMNMPRLYGSRWILCFPLPADTNGALIYENLKKGLAHTISLVPWIAGNIAPEEGRDPEDNRIQVEDSCSGLEFRYKDLSAVLPSYVEMKEKNFPLYLLTTTQLSPLDVMPKPPQPVMAAQANFIKGGLLLTVGIHHSACDASTLDMILSNWAHNTAAAGGFNPSNASEILSTDRSLLMEGKPGARLVDFPEYALMPTPKAAAADVNTHQMAATPFELPPMAMRIFYISPASLAGLKTASSAYSTNDALLAFLWRHITLARNPPDTGYSGTETKTSALLYAVNIRGRTTPPMPPTYLGNAAMACIAGRLDISTLTAESGFVTAATSIRKALQVFKEPDRVPLTIGLLDSRPDPTDFKLAYNGFLGPDISATSWADLGVYQADWGDLGKPESFRTPGEGADGVLAVLPRLKDGGLEVMVGLELGAMERLLKNEEFLKSATLWA